MRFYSVDTLTGKIVGRLTPTTWSLSDPLRTPGVGQLVFPKPAKADRERMLEVTRPRRRWIAAQDDSGAWLWGGPIPRRPVLGEDTVTVSVVDWRSWFYRTPLRPMDEAAGGDYLVTDRDQGLIAKDLFARALTASDFETDSVLGMPPIIVDAPPTTEVARQRTFRRLDRSIGDHLDTLVTTERGVEWWTYVTPSLADPTVLEIHAKVAYPERRQHPAPIRVEYRIGEGGNATDPSWPEGADAPTRVWATGDGEPPDQVWAVDEDIDADVVWEETIGPLDGVSVPATAFEHAYAHRLRGKGYDSTAEFTLTEQALSLADVAPGDRARVIYDDGWESVDLPSARIIERTMSGGRGQPTQQRLVIDLSDTVPPDDGSTPGEAGEEEVE